MLQTILLVSRDAELAQAVFRGLGPLADASRLHAELEPPPGNWRVVLLDEAGCGWEESESGALRLAARLDRLRSLPSHPSLVWLGSRPLPPAVAVRAGALDFVHKERGLSKLGFVVRAQLGVGGWRRIHQRLEQETLPRLEPGAADLRHELNNPLAGILGNAELALAGRARLNPELRLRLERILAMALQLRDLLYCPAPPAPVAQAPSPGH